MNMFSICNPNLSPVEALSLLAALEDADLMACNAVLSALARSGQWQRACEMLRMGWGDFEVQGSLATLEVFRSVVFLVRKTDGEIATSTGPKTHDFPI